MTILPWKMICPVCGKEYDFNPDAGKMFCPRCKEKTGICPEVALRVPVDLKTPKLREKENNLPNMKVDDVTTRIQLEKAIALGVDRITIRGPLCHGVERFFPKSKEEAERRFRASITLLVLARPFLYRYDAYYIVDRTSDTLTVQKYRMQH